MMNPKEERKQDAENGHIKELKDKSYICDRNGGKDYVFISYSSLNWKKVLYEIVYETCKKYGLRVYFDTEFDVGSDSWLTQFKKNMKSKYCKAVLAFFTPEYRSSYATLMELMVTQDIDTKVLVLPIELDSSPVTSPDNTGLGTYRFADNSTNSLWGSEMELFDELFTGFLASCSHENEKQAKASYPKHGKVNTKDNQAAYWEPLDYDRVLSNREYWENKGIYTKEEKAKHWEEILQKEKNEINDVFLSKQKNSNLMQMIRVKIDKHTINGQNKGIPKTIYDKLIKEGLSSVFDDKLKEVLEVAIEPKTSAISENREEPVGIITGPAPLQIHKADSASENQPEALPDLVPGCMQKWTYRTKKGANAVILWDGTSKKCKVLKGSMAAKEAPNFAANALAAKKLKDQLVSQGKLSDLEFIDDCDCDKISTMINLLNGGSVSMPAEIKGKNLRLAEDDADSAEWIPLEAGTDSQKSQFSEPAPLVESEESSSGECIYTYKNARIKCDINSNRCTVLKGSKTQGESQKFVTNAATAKKLKDELKQRQVIENDVFLEDYTGSMATLLNLINGGSVSSTREKKKFVREN